MSGTTGLVELFAFFFSSAAGGIFALIGSDLRSDELVAWPFRLSSLGATGEPFIAFLANDFCLDEETTLSAGFGSALELSR